LFDPEIEKTTRRNNSKTIKQKHLAKSQQHQQDDISNLDLDSHAQSTPIADKN